MLILVHGGFWRPQFGRNQLNAIPASLADAGWSVATIASQELLTPALKTCTVRVRFFHKRLLVMIQVL
jgi:hypothetical protein